MTSQAFSRNRNIVKTTYALVRILVTYCLIGALGCSCIILSETLYLTVKTQASSLTQLYLLFSSIFGISISLFGIDLFNEKAISKYLRKYSPVRSKSLEILDRFTSPDGSSGVMDKIHHNIDVAFKPTPTNDNLSKPKPFGQPQIDEIISLKSQLDEIIKIQDKALKEFQIKAMESLRTMDLNMSDRLAQIDKNAVDILSTIETKVNEMPHQVSAQGQPSNQFPVQTAEDIVFSDRRIIDTVFIEGTEDRHLIVKPVPARIIGLSNGKITFNKSKEPIVFHAAVRMTMLENEIEVLKSKLDVAKFLVHAERDTEVSVIDTDEIE